MNGYVSIYQLMNGQEVEIGMIVLDGGVIRPEPDTEELRRIATTPLNLMSGRVAPSDGEAFLEGLQDYYHGDYLWASPAMLIGDEHEVEEEVEEQVDSSQFQSINRQQP